MSRYGNISGATAKILPACKVVSSKDGEPLEVFGNKHPRYMAASVVKGRNEDRIRLMVQNRCKTRCE